MKISGFVWATVMCVSLHTSASGEAASASVQPPMTDDLNERVQNLITKVKHSLRPIKGGTFEMGDWGTESGRPWDTDADSRPVHKVTLDSFSMMAYKVTYDDFDVFTDATGKARVNMTKNKASDRAPRRPAGVSWHGAKAYCEWLAAKTGLGFDLPTEAQWEYAARSGGKRTLYATDNGQIERGRNFPRSWQYGETEPPLPDVGSYPPNPAGLYGMSEDTSEWVKDWYDENYYKASPTKNPSGPAIGTEKVQRGSVGGMAEGAAMVFMRTSAILQPLRNTYPNGISYVRGLRFPSQVIRATRWTPSAALLSLRQSRIKPTNSRDDVKGTAQCGIQAPAAVFHLAPPRAGIAAPRPDCNCCAASSPLSGVAI